MQASKLPTSGSEVVVVVGAAVVVVVAVQTASSSVPSQVRPVDSGQHCASEMQAAPSAKQIGKKHSPVTQTQMLTVLPAMSSWAQPSTTRQSSLSLQN